MLLAWQSIQLCWKNQELSILILETWNFLDNFLPPLRDFSPWYPLTPWLCSQRCSRAQSCTCVGHRKTFDPDRGKHEVLVSCRTGHISSFLLISSFIRSSGLSLAWASGSRAILWHELRVTRASGRGTYHLCPASFSSKAVQWLQLSHQRGAILGKLQSKAGLPRRLLQREVSQQPAVRTRIRDFLFFRLGLVGVGVVLAVSWTLVILGILEEIGEVEKFQPNLKNQILTKPSTTYKQYCNV